MKFFKRYLAFAVVLVLLFTGCSKEEVGSPIDEPSSETAVLSFGAVLDDLANRAANKGHFGQVPDCEDEADPQVARVTISYGDVTATIDVDILFDGENYYTDYSSELEIPVSVDGDDDNTDDFTTVSLDGFIVYDGDPDDGGNAIWVAPVASVEFPDADFSGYVDNPLPFDIIVRPGVKKYVDVEVLCFDRRMVNQYGYLFFDIIPGELVPLCFFANYCDEDGRHYPGFYGIDLFVEDAQGVRTQIYSSDTSRPEIGDYNANNQDAAEYYAEPLCLVVPGPPNGVDDDEDYLFYVVTPLDWDAAYGEDADNTSLTEEGLSWNEVQELLNRDGDNSTTDYIHLLINCDDNPGGEDCAADSDGDGVFDCEDECDDLQGPSDNNGCPIGDDCSLDSDGDGVKDCIDECDDTPQGVAVDEKGCPLGEDCITDSDGDNVPDCEDECDDEAGSEDNDGCPTTDSGDCDTAWMYGDHTFTKKDNDGLSLSGKWGWAENFVVTEDGSSKTFKFYAGAGGNKISQAKEAGTVTVSTSGSAITVTVVADSDITINKLDIYTSDKKPETASPGQFNKLDDVDGLKDTNPSSTVPNIYTFQYSGDGSFWIAVHGDVCRD